MPVRDTRYSATQEVLAHISRAKDALPSIGQKDLNASGALINPRLYLPALKAALDHIDHVIATIEREWPA